jgi:hypothetical protein
MAERDEITDLSAEAERAMSAEDFDAAERALRKALRLQEAQLGLVHPDVASTLNALGVVCNILGRPDEAEFLYRRAVGIARKELTDDHPYIATSLRNLSELYRTQGKPEKLAKLSDRLAPRSGLPTVDSVGKVESSGAQATSEAVGSDAAPRASSDALDSGLDFDRDDVPPPGRHAWPLRQVALMAGTAVALFAVVWLLTVGSRTSDVPGGSSQTSADNRDRSQPDAAAPVAEEAGGIGRDAERIVPPAADLTPAAAPTPVAVPPETASVSQPISALGDAGDASSWAVADARLCSQLETRGTDGAPLGDWRCTPVVDQAVPGELFFYTRIRSRTSSVVVHRWLRNGSLAQQVDLEVEANDGPGYRTYSLRTLASQERGLWRVELLLADGSLLYAEEFEVR